MTLWGSRTKRGLERSKTACRGIGIRKELLIDSQHLNTVIEDGLEAMQRHRAPCLPLCHPDSRTGA
jgi:hypothetical protein